MWLPVKNTTKSYSQKNTIGPQGSEPALVTKEFTGIYVF